MIHRSMDCRKSAKTTYRSRQGLAVILLLLSLMLPGSALADGAIIVEKNTTEYIFSRQIEFTLNASSDSDITAVILFYGQRDERLVRRIYPDFIPGKQVSVSYTEELVGGQFAPGTLLHYYWQLEARDGTVLRTDPLVFEYTDTNHEWQVITGNKVQLYWYGNKGSLAKDLAAKAEEDIAVLEGRYGINLEQPLRIYVYNNTTDMALAMASRSEGYDNMVTTLGVAVDEATLLLLGSHRDVRQTISHELSHLVVGLATDNPFAGLPLWLDEGLAMYAEGELRSQNKAALNRAIRNNELLTIRSMSSYSGLASQVDLYYGQAYSVVDFLITEYGQEKLQELLLILAEGERQEPALLSVYGFGLDELDRRWRKSIGATVSMATDDGSGLPGATTEPEANSVAEGSNRPVNNRICGLGAGALLVPFIGGVVAVSRRSGHGV